MTNGWTLRQSKCAQEVCTKNHTRGRKVRYNG